MIIMPINNTRLENLTSIWLNITKLVAAQMSRIRINAPNVVTQLMKVRLLVVKKQAPNNPHNNFSSKRYCIWLMAKIEVDKKTGIPNNTILVLKRQITISIYNPFLLLIKIQAKIQDILSWKLTKKMRILTLTILIFIKITNSLLIRLAWSQWRVRNRREMREVRSTRFYRISLGC